MECQSKFQGGGGSQESMGLKVARKGLDIPVFGILLQLHQ